MTHAIVIGSGIGGLASAIRIARRGIHVHVYAVKLCHLCFFFVVVFKLIVVNHILLSCGCVIYLRYYMFIGLGCQPKRIRESLARSRIKSTATQKNIKNAAPVCPDGMELNSLIKRPGTICHFTPELAK